MSAHAADRHDLIRVQGARVNNLKDVSVEIPKRRLTVFTGVSGSGKSSLVFGTIAAESQRMINETYSAFVQGFMPTLARPDVDVLEGLTTAILVDQERMGATRAPPSAPRPTSTRCCASSSAASARRTSVAAGVLVQRRVHQRRGAVTIERGGKTGEGEAELRDHRRDVPALRGPRAR
jgi:energy-coupling factor transporter ATP-binding protein EcfA2